MWLTKPGELDDDELFLPPPPPTLELERLLILFTGDKLYLSFKLT
jgi:hypothetical protein